MRKWLITLLLILISVVGLYQLRVPHLLLGKYLSPSDNLVKADAIVVVSGDTDRIQHAIDLYKKGYAPKLILSGAQKEGPTSNAFAMHLEASRSGVPDDAVLLEEKAINTFENALYVKDIVTSNGFKSLILVSSPYHQRRVYETFRSVFRGSGIRLQNSPSPYSKWKADNWWEGYYTKVLTAEETTKILWANISGNYK